MPSRFSIGDPRFAKVVALAKKFIGYIVLSKILLDCSNLHCSSRYENDGWISFSGATISSYKKTKNQGNSESACEKGL